MDENDEFHHTSGLVSVPDSLGSLPKFNFDPIVEDEQAPRSDSTYAWAKGLNTQLLLQTRPVNFKKDVEWGRFWEMIETHRDAKVPNCFVPPSFYNPHTEADIV